MTMSKREKVLVIIVLVMIILCLYFLFSLKPNLDELKVLNNDIEDKELQASTMAQQKIIISSIDKALKDNEASKNELDDGLTIGFDQPAALVYLKNTVNEHATKVMFKFDERRQVGQLSIATVQINMNSSFEGLKALLKAFGSGPYIIKVVSVEVTEPGETAETPDVVVVDSEESTAQTTTPSSPVPDSGEKSVKLTIEIFTQPGEVAAGQAYEFSNGYQYGGDIFH